MLITARLTNLEHLSVNNEVSLRVPPAQAQTSSACSSTGCGAIRPSQQAATDAKVECGAVAAKVTVRQSYTRAEFRTPASLADEAAGILVAGGAIGCAVAGMAKPHARGPQTVTLEAYFNHISNPELARLREKLEQAGMLVEGGDDPGAHRNGIISVPVRRVIDPGWATLWMHRFGPFRVGKRFLIVPPWRRESEAGRTTIVIEPAQAFGTGHHPTTAGALRAIENRLRTHQPGAMLDAGTGSGVLAIAAALLGARNVMAIDVDAIALENARANARLNGVEKSIRFSSVPLKSIHRHFDFITANILSHTLIELAPHLKRILAPGGRLVLGGFLADEADEVISLYRGDLRCLSIKTHRGWTTALLARAPRE